MRNLKMKLTLYLKIMNHLDTKKVIQGERENIKNNIQYLVNLSNNFPKLSSHYCRQSTRKFFLQTEINSISQLHNIYCDTCKTNDEESLVRKKILDVFNEKNLLILSLKKVKYNVCCQYKLYNLPEEEYHNHIFRKNQAREENTN